MGRFLRVARQLTEEMARLEERLGDGLSAQVVLTVSRVGRYTCLCSANIRLRGEQNEDTAAVPAGRDQFQTMQSHHSSPRSATLGRT